MSKQGPVPRLTSPRLEAFVGGKAAKQQGGKTEKLFKATLYFPGALHLRLKIRAAETRTSVSDLVVTAVERLLKEK